MCRPERCTDRRARPPARARRLVRTRWRRLSKGLSFLILLLLPFLPEDILAAIFDALALVRLGLAPAADLGGELADLLPIDAADLHRGVVRRLDLEALRHRDVDVVAVAELQLQRLALGRG